MFKEQDDKGTSPFDLGYKVGEIGGGEHNPYDEYTEAYEEFSGGYYDGAMNWNEEDDYSA